MQTTVFGLDPQAIASRVKAVGQPVRVPSLGESLLRGVIGFTIVSVAGFMPWVLAGRWLSKNTGDIGMYGACAVVFLACSGLALHRLIIGPGSLKRCYQIFSLAFIVYAIFWTITYKLMPNVIGGVVGGLVGMAAMGLVFAAGFQVWNRALMIISALFLTNIAGYFLGGVVHDFVHSSMPGKTGGIVSKAAWGLCYGLGFGAGIGLAFYLCQSEARRLIAGKSE
jgi:hypothetical protein